MQSSNLLTSEQCLLAGYYAFSQTFIAYARGTILA